MIQTTTVLIAVLLQVGGGAAQHPDLSGHWALNAAQSQNPRDMMQGRDSGGSERSGGLMRGGGGRGGFGGRGGGDRMSDAQRARMHQTMQLAFTAPTSLAIVESDSTVTLIADGDTLVLPSNGHKVRRESTVDGEGPVDIKGHWQGSDFVVERNVSGGGKVSEDYLRSSDGKQLYVIVSFDGARGRNIMFRRIYDPAS